MKNLFPIILFVLAFIGILGLVGRIDKQGEELIMVKQLYNVQQNMLQDNFSKQELDSMYLDYNYKHILEYYQNNYK